MSKQAIANKHFATVPIAKQNKKRNEVKSLF